MCSRYCRGPADSSELDGPRDTGGAGRKWRRRLGCAGSGREAGTSSRQVDDSSKKPGPVKLGAGLLAVPGVLAGMIRRGEYVDFAELPPTLPDVSTAGVQSSE